MKNKLLYLTLSILSVSLFFSHHAFSQNTVVRVVPSSVPSPRVGQQFTVDIDIENGRNVSGYQVMLEFEYPALEYVGIQRGDYLPADAFLTEPNFIGGNGRLFFAATASPHERNGNGTLATLTFEINEVKPSTFRLIAGRSSQPRHGTILSNKSVTLSFPRTENADIFRGVGAYDLVVESREVRDPIVAPGADFTLTVTVANRGGGITPLITMFYYLSTDPHISRRTDTQIHSVQLSSLGANQTDTVSKTLTAPTTPGTYYYGACVNSTVDEADPDNNCSDTVEIIVTRNIIPPPEDPSKRIEEEFGVVEQQPDLVIKAVQAEPSTVAPGDELKLYVTLENQGTARSAATTLRYYYTQVGKGNGDPLSKDREYLDVQALPKGFGFRTFLKVPAPTEPGTYYYGFCVDEVDNESNTRNNCYSDANPVTVAFDSIDLEGVSDRTLTGHNGPVNCLAFSPDGSKLASGSLDQTIRLWETGTNGASKILKGQNAAVYSVAFNANGDTLASGGEGGTVLLWDVNAGTYRALPRVHQGRVRVAFSPDGRTLASAGSDGKVLLWNVVTNRHKILRKPSPEMTRSIAFAPDGTLAIGAGAFVELWNTVIGNHVATFAGHRHNSVVNNLAFSPDGSRLASGGTDKTVRLWDAHARLQTATPLYTLTQHIDWVDGVAFSPDGRTLASSSNMTVRLWDESMGHYQHTLLQNRDPNHWIHSLAFSPNGRTVASGHRNGTVRLSNVPSSLPPPHLTRQAAMDVVHLIYFVPSDHTPDPDSEAYFDGLIRNAQQFFAQQMASHGFGEKTFAFETEATGKAKVNIILGAEPAANYRFRDKEGREQFNNDKVVREISKKLEGFDVEREIYLIGIDFTDTADSEFLADRTCGIAWPGWDRAEWWELWQKQATIGGVAIIPYASFGCFDDDTTAHELGHAFGLKHDFRDATYIMSYGDSRSQLSQCAAEWLDGSRYFNEKLPGSKNKTRIERHSPSVYLSDAPNLNMEFKVEDANGLHQAQFLIPVLGTDPSTVGRKLHSCIPLSGQSQTVKFDVEMGALITASPVDDVRITVRLQVIDKHGYITRETFSLEIKPGSIRMDVNGDGVVDPADTIVVLLNMGQIGQNDADVNGDGVVDAHDVALVLREIENAAGAPAFRSRVLELITAEEVQQWLTEARLSGETSPAYLRGIAMLEQILALLTPQETLLLANYPNPFNPETWIPYRLSAPAEVTLTIYAVNGQVVRTLDLGHQAVGFYESRSRAAYWDGRNAYGEPVASGVYFYTLEVGDFTATRKMLIRK